MVAFVGGCDRAVAVVHNTVELWAVTNVRACVCVFSGEKLQSWTDPSARIAHRPPGGAQALIPSQEATFKLTSDMSDMM